MEYFLVMYDSRVVIYERKMFIRLATGFALVCQMLPDIKFGFTFHSNMNIVTWNEIGKRGFT